MLIAKVLSRVLGEGQLTTIDPGGRTHRVKGARPGPAVTVRIHRWWTGLMLALRPRLALGEAYMNGTLTIENGGRVVSSASVFDNSIGDSTSGVPGFGTVTVNGPGSTWTITDSGHNFVVGATGSGVLIIENGGDGQRQQRDNWQ